MEPLRRTGARASPGASRPISWAPASLSATSSLLLNGQIPGGLFPTSAPGPDAAILGLGALYLLLQIFLTGRPDRRLPRAAGRLDLPRARPRLRLLLRPTLAREPAGARSRGLVFAANLPFARWSDGVAREAVSERTALALTLGRYALLLLALVAVHMVSSFAKVIVVVRERRSAFLAFVSSAGFCARHLAAVVGQYLVVAALGVAALLAFGIVDARLNVVGWKTQLVALALFESFVAVRIALRLGLLAAQLELLRAHGR